MGSLNVQTSMGRLSLLFLSKGASKVYMSFFLEVIIHSYLCLTGVDLTRGRNHDSLLDSSTKFSVIFLLNFFSVKCGWLALKTLHCDTILCLSEHVILPLISSLQFTVVNLFSTLAWRECVELPMQVSHLFRFYNPCLSSPVNLVLAAC